MHGYFKNTFFIFIFNDLRLRFNQSRLILLFRILSLYQISPPFLWIGFVLSHPPFLPLSFVLHLTSYFEIDMCDNVIYN